ncbi:MAG: hypothetical protein R2932_23580 [Caldilineaceae bacterium]
MTDDRADECPARYDRDRDDSKCAVGAEHWLLVPTTAIQQRNGQSVVTVVDGENSREVVVEPGAVQGEWTVVQSAGLTADTQVQGSLASYTNDNNGFRGNGGGPMGGGPPPGQ